MRFDINGKRVYGLTNTLDFARKLIESNVKIIQYRDKDITDREFMAVAKKIASLCRKNKITCIINDRYYLNGAIRADGVHIGQKDESLPTVRKKMGNKIIGQSIKTAEQAKRAQAEGADYVSVSPVFASANKKEERGLGLERLREAARAVAVPVYAIGGITETNLPAVGEAGADGAAFIGELMKARDLSEKINRLNKILNNEP